MKKVITIIAAGLVSFSVNAQGGLDMEFRPEVFRGVAAIFVVGMFMYFIIDILRRIFEHRLKNKIVDKGISENIAQSILATQKREDNRFANVKWFAILAGIGLGLMVVNYTQPLGFHSLAIMAFSISLSFLGYYFFTRSAGK